MSQPDDVMLARVEVTGTVSEWNIPVYAHLQEPTGKEYALVMATLATLDKSKKIYLILESTGKKAANEGYFIALERTPGARLQAGHILSVLHDDGLQIVVRATAKQVEELSMVGFDVAELDCPIIFRSPKIVESEVKHLTAIDNIVHSVQQETLRQYTGNLSGEWPVQVSGSSYTIVSRNTNSGTPIQKATQYVYEFMQTLGLNTSFHDWQSWSGANRNVIGEKRGTTKPQEIVLITAHLDSMPSSSSNSPGADDNGSGSAGVMVAAEILSQYNFERTLRFVFFTGEEQGLVGSSAYATSVSQSGENIVAVYNMDMIAWDSGGAPTLRLHTRTTSNAGYQADRAIADLFIQVVNTYVINLTPIIDADACAYSDHASFWKKGYAGLLAIEDDEDDFCGNYHTSRDKLATLNLSYFTAYVKATLGCAAHLGKIVSK
jgi:hypothetical protein